MPIELAVAVVADGLAVHRDVRHDGHLGRSRDVDVARLAEIGRAFEVAEALGKPREFDVVEIVAAQADDEALAQRALDDGDVAIARGHEVDAVDVRAERGGRGTDGGFGKRRWPWSKRGSMKRAAGYVLRRYLSTL